MKPSLKTKLDARSIAMNNTKNVRNFTNNELFDFQELTRMVFTYRFLANQIKDNTALIPDGQKVMEQYEAIARLIENSKNQWIGSKLIEMGYPQGTNVSVDPKTGAIHYVES